jgi:hypothetical protein
MGDFKDYAALGENRPLQFGDGLRIGAIRCNPRLVLMASDTLVLPPAFCRNASEGLSGWPLYAACW